MIFVTTAGKVGSETVRILRRKEVPVGVLVRGPEKGKSLAEIGAEIVVGDLDSLPSIDKAMKGIKTVVLVSPGIPAQELNVVQSAKNAGVEQVMKVTSNASAVSPIARRIRLLGRQRACGHDRCPGCGRCGCRDGHFTRFARRKDLQTHRPKTHHLCRRGGNPLKGARSVTYHELSFEKEKDAMIQADLPKELAEMNAQTFRMIAGGEASWRSRDLPSLLGRPARSFEAFAADYASAFS
jgi:hypothetical protein